MPRMPLKPEVGDASVPQELREQESDYLAHKHKHEQNQTTSPSFISSITAPSLILIALFILQAFDTSNFLRIIELFLRQNCMNATTFYCGLIDWVLGHVDRIMFILQTTASFSAVAW